MNYTAFKNIVWKFYKENGRHSLPWRTIRDPYRILVSEIMLQQTQVDRVIPKYKSFLKKFPTARKLAHASAKEVLNEWIGLGYNRRALNLKRAVEIITKDFKDKFPTEYAELLKLPGVGPATAGDLLAFAYNTPAVVIETNIRTVFLHHFFKDKNGVPDKEILTLVKKTLDTKNPREWYYALMDYGTHLKQTLGNNTKQSKHYKKQSAFKGSNREVRSKILKLILKKGRTAAEIMKLLEMPAEPVRQNILALKKEGFIHKNGPFFTS